MLLRCLVPSLLLCGASAQTYSSCAVFYTEVKNAATDQDWVNGQTELTDKQKAGFNAALNLALNQTNTDATYFEIKSTKVNGRATSHYFTAQVDDLTEEQTGGLRVGVSMGQDKVVEDCNAEIDAHFLANNWANSDKTGSVTVVLEAKCESGSDIPAPTKESAKAAIKASMKLRLQSDICTIVNNDALFFPLVESIKQAIADVFRLELRNVDIEGFAEECTARRRRLLATSTEPEINYALTGLSVGQTEAITADSESPAFKAKMASELALADPAFDGAEVTDTEMEAPSGDASKYLYEPPTYERTTDVESLHGVVRLQGGNEPDF
jgi:hypothetical protein